MKVPLFAFPWGRFRSLCLRRALAAILSVGLITGFVAGASAQNDSARQIRGEAVVLAIDDFQTHTSETRYYIRDEKTGNPEELKFLDRAPENFQTGATVSASGTQIGQQLTLRGADVSVERPTVMSPLAASKAAAPTAPSANAAPVAFTQNAIVMLVNFLDQAVSCTMATCNLNVFGATNSTQSLYAETSYGNLSYTGKTVGTYTIAVRTTDSCATGYLPTLENWASLADAQAQAAGVDLSAYTEKVYVLPTPNSCGGQRGYATIGGSPGMAWIWICKDPEVFAHEMGHNLGMHHASTPTSEYGDHSDIMGSTTIGLRDLDAPHRDQFNWIPSANLVNLAAGGTYTLAPLELVPSTTALPQALKIPKPDTNEYYYFSFRQPLNYDSILPTFYAGLYTDGVSVHRFAGATASNVHTYFLQGLTDGASFVDSTNKITVTQISHSSSGARVTVSVGSAVAGVSSSSLLFADQAVNTTSAVQTITLSNNGGAALSISSIGITGANSGDFVLSSNGCGASLAAGTSCTIGVEFHPTTSGTRSASLTISDSAGTQEVSLSGTTVLPDFTLAASVSGSETVNAGSTATFAVKVGSTNGFTSSVSMSCVLSAASATCSANPGVVAPGSNTTITVTTTAHQLAPPTGLPWRFGPWQEIIMLVLLLVLSLLLRARGKENLRPRVALTLAASLVLVSLQIGCAGTVSSNDSGTPPAIRGTQAGSYTITVTGTSGNVSHTTSVELVVK